MANWIGSARSNYVQLAEGVTKERLLKALALFSGLRLSFSLIDDNLTVGFFGDDSDSGDFPSFYLGENDEELEFTWEADVMPFIAPDQVLIVMTVGAEKLRYLTGVAAAFVRRADNSVEAVSLDLEDAIIKLATIAFKVEPALISVPQY